MTGFGKTKKYERLKRKLEETNQYNLHVQIA